MKLFYRSRAFNDAMPGRPAERGIQPAPRWRPAPIDSIKITRRRRVALPRPKPGRDCVTYIRRSRAPKLSTRYGWTFSARRTGSVANGLESSSSPEPHRNSVLQMTMMMMMTLIIYIFILHKAPKTTNTHTHRETDRWQYEQENRTRPILNNWCYVYALRRH